MVSFKGTGDPCLRSNSFPTHSHRTSGNEARNPPRRAKATRAKAWLWATRLGEIIRRVSQNPGGGGGQTKRKPGVSKLYWGGGGAFWMVVSKAKRKPGISNFEKYIHVQSLLGFAIPLNFKKAVLFRLANWINPTHGDKVGLLPCHCRGCFPLLLGYLLLKTRVSMVNTPYLVEGRHHTPKKGGYLE